MDGIINIYKEAGFTSHDVIAKLRGMLRTRKIGHTGTLDPDAVGVLPVCVGRATKACDMLTDKSKIYEAVIHLGVTTDTEDSSGKVLSIQDVNVSEEELREVMLSFIGNYDQIPPMYSAIKINGQKLYDIAREGRVVERQPRPVTIYQLDIISMELPFATFRVSCSKGTYIRSLCRDIGDKLGCGACMEHLTRTKVGEFVIEDALTLSQVQELVDNGCVEEKIKPTDQLFLNYPAVKTEKMTAHKLAINGNPISARNIQLDETLKTDGQWVRLYNKEDEFVGIYKYTRERNRLMPVKMFLN